MEPELGNELRTSVDRLASDAKAAIQRKLNSIYADHAERLKRRIAELEREVEASAPGYRRRLEEFERKLREVVTSYQSRLDEPERDLKIMISQHKEELVKDIKSIGADSRTLMRTEAARMEKRVDKMIEARLHDLIVEAVRKHVRSSPFETDGLSNRQLAAAKGISLRAAKRLRRGRVA